MSKVKIKTCQYCGSVIPESGACGVCGGEAFTGMGCFYYGKGKMNSQGNAEIVLTRNCYLIVKKGSNGAGTGVGMATFGALGAVVGGLADSAVSSLSPHGFYDLTEVSVVQHPYPLKGVKPERVFRFICHDGRDFVLSFGKKPAMQFEAALSQLGIYMTNMSGEPATKICCQNPLVDKKTFDKRVCAALANRIELKNGQFPGNPILPKENIRFGGVTIEKATPNGNNQKSSNDEPPFFPCLYGCPTAKELPGTVPDCMLTTFEGYEIHEI